MATKTTKETKATKTTKATPQIEAPKGSTPLGFRATPKTDKALTRKAKAEAAPQEATATATAEPKAKAEAAPSWSRCRIQLDGVGARAFARWAGAAGWANNEIAEYLNERGASIPSKSVWFYAREGRGAEGSHGVGKRDGSFPETAVARWTKDREAIRTRLASKAKAEPKAE